jgi:hypothetical protein
MQYEVKGVSRASSMGRDSIMTAPLFAAEPEFAAGVVFGIQASTLLAAGFPSCCGTGPRTGPRCVILLPMPRLVLRSECDGGGWRFGSRTYRSHGFAVITARFQVCARRLCRKDGRDGRAVDH